jgi:hypothetical protein
MTMTLLLDQKNIMLPTKPKFLTEPVSPRQSSIKKNDKRVHLGPDFEPGNNAVICGRGKACCESPGNLRLRSIVDSFTQTYATAITKEQKSAIIARIIFTVKQTEGGLFVKHEDGTWWEVDDGYAKEKIGYMLRDFLHTKYRSSTRAKEARKKSGPNLALRNDNSYGHRRHSHCGVEVPQLPDNQHRCRRESNESRSGELLEGATSRTGVVRESEFVQASRIWFSTDLPHWAAKRTATVFATQQCPSPSSLGPLHSVTTIKTASHSRKEVLRNQHFSEIIELDLPGSPARIGSQLRSDRKKLMKSASKSLSSSDDATAESELATPTLSIEPRKHKYSVTTTSINAVADVMFREDEDSSSMGTIEGADALLYAHDERILEERILEDFSDIF